MEYKAYLLHSNQSTTPICEHCDSYEAAVAQGFQYLEQSKYKNVVTPYHRYWMMAQKTYIDFGSGSTYLIITTQDDNEIE